MSKSPDTKGEHYFDGLPTEPDIRRILEEYPVESLKEGVVIPRAEIARIARTEYGSKRHDTVEAAFRRQMLRLHNIAFGRGDGVLTVLDPRGRIKYASDRQHTGSKMVVRAGKLAHATDLKRLSPEERRAADHQIRFAAAVSGAARTAPKKQEPPELDMGKK